MSNQARLEQAERVLRQLVELHDLQSKTLADNYDSVRRVRRESSKAWDEARLWLASGEKRDAA